MQAEQMHTRRRRRRRVAALVAVAVAAATAVVGAVVLDGSSPSVTAAPAGEAVEGGAISPMLRTKLARFAPGEPAREGSVEEEGAGALEWTQHATPNDAIPLAAINGSRADWKAFKSRGNSAAKLGDHGR